MKFNEEIRSEYYLANKIYNNESDETLKKNNLKQIVLDKKYIFRNNTNHIFSCI